MSCENCTCEKCVAEVTPQHRISPWECGKCGLTFYERIDPRFLGEVGLQCPECHGQADFVGFTDEELARRDNTSNWKKDRYQRLQEGHNWEETGMLNPHTLPLRDTPNWEHYVREGRIKKDSQGRDCLYSKDKKQWADSMKDLGYATADGAGDVNKSRQQGEHLRED